jgi:hypothetical protein
MKEYLAAALLVILLAMAVSAFGQTWGPYTDESIDLTITRTALTSGWWEWKFDVVNNSPQVLHLFTAGFNIAEAAPWDSVSGHYRNWATSVAGATAAEGPGNIRWMRNLGLIGTGGTAWFSYQTDLPLIAVADYQARDGQVSGDYDEKPAPSVPGPSSLLAFAGGMASLVAFRRRRA